MQQINVYIKKQYLFDGKEKDRVNKDFFIYEVQFPVIRIGSLKYINSYTEQITLRDQDIVIKRYTGDSDISQIDLIKEDIRKCYPEEVWDLIVFTLVK